MTAARAQPGPIVVGVERSERSRDALALAGRLARAAGSRLLLVAVYPVGARSAAIERGAYARALAEEAEAALDWVMAPLAGERPEARAVPSTSIPRGLQRIAELEGALAIVVGPSHRGPLGRILPGSVGERLLRGAPCPVAVAPAGYRDCADGEITRIGVGFLAMPEADRALCAAIGLATHTGAAVRVLSVIEPAAVSSAMPFGWELDELEATAREELAVRIRRATHRLAAPLEIAGEVVDGYADDELAQPLPRGRPPGLRVLGPPPGGQRDARRGVDRHPAQGALPAAGRPARRARRLRRARRAGGAQRLAEPPRLAL